MNDIELALERERLEDERYKRQAWEDENDTCCDEEQESFNAALERERLEDERYKQFD